MMAICKALGNGYELGELKKIYPISDDDILESIQFFCKYTDFDPHHIMTFKKLQFDEYKVTLQIQGNTQNVICVCLTDLFMYIIK